VRDLNDRLLKQQRIIDHLHEEIKKLQEGAGGGGCDSNVIIQRVCGPITSSVRLDCKLEVNDYTRGHFPVKNSIFRGWLVGWGLTALSHKHGTFVP